MHFNVLHICRDTGRTWEVYEGTISCCEVTVLTTAPPSRRPWASGVITQHLDHEFCIRFDLSYVWRLSRLLLCLTLTLQLCGLVPWSLAGSVCCCGIKHCGVSKRKCHQTKPLSCCLSLMKVIPALHNEWLHATVVSCFACSRSCLAPVWGHNEAIFLTDFACVEATERLSSSHTHTPSDAVALLGPVILPGWGRMASVRLLPSPPHRQSHTLSIINTEVFLSFQYSYPNGILRAIFVESKCKRNVFNYLSPKVFALPNSSPSSFSVSLSCFHSTGPWLDAAFLSKHCISPGYPTGEFVWSHHIYRLAFALCYLVLWTGSYLSLADRGAGQGSVVHRPPTAVTDVERKIFSLSQCLFSQLCLKVAFGDAAL